MVDAPAHVQLPIRAVEAMSAEECSATALEQFPGRVALACSFQKEESVLLDLLFGIEPKARVFAIDTHYLFPETYELWREVEQRYDTKVEVFEGPSAEQLAATHGESSGSASRTSTSRSPRSSRSSARSAASTPGSPAFAATSRRRVPTRRSSAGTPRTSCGRRTRSPTGATTTAGPTSASAGCPTTRCTTAATRRSATRTRRCRAPAARAAGPDPTAPSAACTRRGGREPVGLASYALAPRRARVRGDPHHARGRRRARAAGAALLGRQGLDRAATPRREGFPARPVPVPGHARRHGPQLPGGDRVPGPPRGGARRAARRRQRPGVDRQGTRRDETGPRASRNQLQTTTLLDAIEEHRFDAAMGGARRDEERAARRSASSASATTSASGTRARSGPSSGTSTTRAPQGRARPRLPDLELDGARRLAVRRARAARAAADLLRPRAEVFKRDGMLYAVSEFVERCPEEAAVHGHCPLPHGR